MENTTTSLSKKTTEMHVSDTAGLMTWVFTHLGGACLTFNRVSGSSLLACLTAGQKAVELVAAVR